MEAKIKGRTVPKHKDNLGRKHTQKVKIYIHVIRMNLDKTTRRVCQTTGKTRGKTGRKWNLGKPGMRWEAGRKESRTEEISIQQPICRSSKTENGTGTG